MRREYFVNKIGELDDDIIDNVSKTRKVKQVKRSQRKMWLRITAVAACICLVISGLYFTPLREMMRTEKAHGNEDITNLPQISSPFVAHAISEAIYPVMKKNIESIVEPTDDDWAQMDKWYDEGRDQMHSLDGYNHPLDTFISKSISTFLENSDGDNKVISPLNIYVALSVLAEATDGESRSQILDLLGESDIENLRQLNNDMWKAVYRDDGASKIVLSNSIWLSDDVSYNKEGFDLIADKYFSSSFSGQMGSEEYNDCFREWLSKGTGGMLDEYIKNENLDANTLFALASTIFFSAKWNEAFMKDFNTEGVFHGVNGDTDSEFLNKSSISEYYDADGFSAVEKQFTNFCGTMWFIRPDDGAEMSDILESTAFKNMISNVKMPSSRFVNLNLSVPKFDVSSNFNLNESLEKLGVTDIFSSEESDFSKVLESDGAFISKVGHSAGIKIDEEGCQAAAYTHDIGAGEPLPPDETIDFTLDKPFIVFIQSQTGLPLFVGVVNNIN